MQKSVLWWQHDKVNSDSCKFFDLFVPALQARTIDQQLKGSKKGAGKKEKGGKDSSASQPVKESSDSNPHTKALVEKKAKETGESAADIRKKIKCHNCGKAGRRLTMARIEVNRCWTHECTFSHSYACA